jgi:hypothetical protein
MIELRSGHIISTVEMRNGYNILIGKLNIRDTFGDRSIDGKIILK